MNEEFNEIFNELADSECDMTVEEYVDFDVKTYSSLSGNQLWYSDLNEVASDNDDDKDDDDNYANSKDVEVV